MSLGSVQKGSEHTLLLPGLLDGDRLENGGTSLLSSSIWKKEVDASSGDRSDSGLGLKFSELSVDVLLAWCLVPHRALSSWSVFELTLEHRERLVNVLLSRLRRRLALPNQSCSWRSVILVCLANLSFSLHSGYGFSGCETIQSVRMRVAVLHE